MAAAYSTTDSIPCLTLPAARADFEVLHHNGDQDGDHAIAECF